MSIFEQIGGQAVVKTAVTVFYARVADDPSLGHWFDGVNLTRLSAHQRAFLTAALGGPELFAGRDLTTAHEGMQITDEAFSALVEHLLVTLGDLEITADAITAVGERLESLRAAVVAPRQPD